MSELFISTTEFFPVESLCFSRWCLHRRLLVVKFSWHSGLRLQRKDRPVTWSSAWRRNNFLVRNILLHCLHFQSFFSFITRLSTSCSFLSWNLWFDIRWCLSFSTITLWDLCLWPESLDLEGKFWLHSSQEYERPLTWSSACRRSLDFLWKRLLHSLHFQNPFSLIKSCSTSWSFCWCKPNLSFLVESWSLFSKNTFNIFAISRELSFCPGIIMPSGESSSESDRSWSFIKISWISSSSSYFFSVAARLLILVLSSVTSVFSTFIL